MPAEANDSPNPKRVAAGRRNQLKRKGLSPAGREKLRQTALKHQPWRFSTGPRTPEGKAKVALNGRRRQVGAPKCVREFRAELSELATLLAGMASNRQMAVGDE